MRNFNTPEEKEAFVCGTECVKDYILFCMRHYVYDLLKDGKLCFENNNSFHRDMNMFLLRMATDIPNKQGVDFKDFCDNYEKYRLKL